MDRSYGQLTVYFEDPFWVGVFERITGGKLSVCKVTFGAEPKEYKFWTLFSNIITTCTSARLWKPEKNKLRITRNEGREMPESSS